MRQWITPRTKSGLGDAPVDAVVAARLLAILEPVEAAQVGLEKHRRRRPGAAARPPRRCGGRARGGSRLENDHRGAICRQPLPVLRPLRGRRRRCPRACRRPSAAFHQRPLARRGSRCRRRARSSGIARTRAWPIAIGRPISRGRLGFLAGKCAWAPGEGFVAGRRTRHGCCCCFLAFLPAARALRRERPRFSGASRVKRAYSIPRTAGCGILRA